MACRCGASPYMEAGAGLGRRGVVCVTLSASSTFPDIQLDMAALVAHPQDTLPSPSSLSPEQDPTPNKISAYYSLVFPNFTYYLQTLTVTIGRRCIPTSSASSSDIPQVDVDLGPLKSVSRLHAKIEYEEEEERFVLIVLGRNGAWVDGVWSGSGCKVPLSDRYVRFRYSAACRSTSHCCTDRRYKSHLALSTLSYPLPLFLKIRHPRALILQTTASARLPSTSLMSPPYLRHHPFHPAHLRLPSLYHRPTRYPHWKHSFQIPIQSANANLMRRSVGSRMRLCLHLHRK